MMPDRFAGAPIEPLIPPAKRGGGKRTVNQCEAVNGPMCVLSTGYQWRAIPKDLPPRSTVHGYSGLRQGLGMPEPQGAGLPALGVVPVYAKKALSEKNMIRTDA
jgi:transposase